MSKLGKLRMWGKGFAKDLKGPDPTDVDPRSTFDADLKALDEDLSLRRRGLERLLAVSDAYGRAFFKRKDFDDPSRASGVRKLNVQDALGLHMQTYGEALGDVPFGRGLRAYGEARCRVAEEWRAFGRSYNERWHEALDGALRVVKEVQAQRKGLEKKKAAHEASYNKLQRAKSDKNAEAMEEDVARAYAAYESMLEEVQSRVLEIEEYERGLLAQTVQLVEDELEYVNTYRDVLLGVKAELGTASETKARPPAKSASRSSLSSAPFARRPSARSLHSLSLSLSNSHSTATASERERTGPSPLGHARTHSHQHQHQLRREASTLSRGQASPMSRGRHWGEWGWSEIAAAEGGGEGEGEDDDKESVLSPRDRERGRERNRWGDDEDEDEDGDGDGDGDGDEDGDEDGPPAPRAPAPKLPRRPPSLGKLSIPALPALPARPRGSPLTPGAGGRSRKPHAGPVRGETDSDAAASDSGLVHSDDAEGSDAELGLGSGDGSGGGGGRGARTPAEERADPLLSASTARAPALPPRRMNSFRAPPPPPPPTPPRRNGSYAGTPVQRKREELAVEDVRSPFDTTDESDA